MHSNIKKYVYYDKNGNITAIRNSNTSSDNIPCLEVELDQVIDLVTGAKPFSNYCIMFDTISKKNQLTIKTVDEINNYDANRSIYKIQKSSNADVTIIKNCNNNFGGEDFIKLDQTAIHSYMQHLSRKGLSTRTLARRLASIKSLYKYMDFSSVEYCNVCMYNYIQASYNSIIQSFIQPD